LIKCARPPAANGPVQALHVELHLALELDKPHGWSRRCFGNCFGIPLVVLLRFDIRLHVFRRHQPDLVANAMERAAEMVRATASLHRHDARGQARSQLDHTIAVHPPAQDDPPCRIQSRDAAAIFAQVDP
jgi:hypothetical protein